ncbi:MAG: glycosyltransferase family 4 protein [Gemmatimonadota bacterium]
MRILYVWDADYPWDVRVEKICNSLVGNGHEMHIASRNRARRPVTEALPEGTVHRMPSWSALPASLDSWTSFPAFCNPRWLLHLDRTVQRVRPSALIVRDLPLAPTAIHVSRKHGVPVILDMAENYPAMIRDIWTARRQRPWDVLVRNPRMVKQVERWCVRRVDQTLVVVEESGTRLQTEYGLAADRMSLVSNTPPLSRVSALPKIHTSDRPLEVVYLGIMETPRGVLELLEAQQILRSSGVRVRIRLIGDGRDLELFKARAGELGLTPDDVQFTGRIQRHEDALALVNRADVGVVPYQASETWQSTIPNKIFDYMAAGLAVVTSDVAPCKRILHESGAGVVFRAGDAADLARVLAKLCDAAYRTMLGENGRRAILSRHNWERDTTELLSALHRVESSRSSARNNVPEVTIAGALPATEFTVAGS